VSDQLVIGGQLGNYVIDSVVGRGGMSVVYRARHSRLGMWVALKVLAPQLGSDDAFRERFLREAQMAATVDHPNVIPIHDMGVHEDSLYIVMRYVAGGDLKSLMAAKGPLEPDETIALLMPVALALDAAHAKGLVHRDVKPANVLIQRSATGAVEHVYLTDFGIAKSDAFLTGLTGTGVFIGTIEYMAPEQIESRDVGPQTDVYALAATFYQCLTARVPFQRELAEGIRPPTGELEPLGAVRSGMPPQLDSVLAKALSRNPADRHRTCEEFLHACEDALAGYTAAAQEPAASAFPPTRLSEGPPDLAGAAAPSQLASESAPVEVAASSVVGAASTVGGASHEEAAAAAGALAGGVVPPAGPDGGAGDSKRSGGFGKRGLVAIGVLVLAAAAAAIVVLVSSSGSGSPGGRLSSSQLGAVPTNHVTGAGTVTVRLVGNEATVTLTTAGLDNDAPLVHAMHIHGGGKGECPPASAARLHNGHLAIDTNDGINYYGPPVQSLTTRGDTSVASILTFPRYPSGGALHYKRTIALPPKVLAFIRENNAVVVVHGIDYDNSGIYSGVLDRSDLDQALPATATAPALCGRLVGAQIVAAAGNRHRPRRTRAVVYTASLTTTTLSASELFYCQAPEGLATSAPPLDTRRRTSTRAATHSQATA
jgi:protein kinase-like protein